MGIDHTTLLISIIVIAAALSFVLVAGWLASRGQSFLMTWSAGLAVIVVALILFKIQLDGSKPVLTLPAFGLMLAGLCIVEAAGFQFRTDGSPWRRCARSAAASFVLIAPFFIVGVDGLGIALVNLFAGLLLIGAGVHYWRARAEAPLSMSVMTGLYALVGASFLLCAVVILHESPIHRVRTPDNWAENLNALAALLGMAGIGAISLALHQSRLVARLHVDSNTDPLTGMANRRALFARHGEAPLAPATAVAIFDLDHFKGINDRYGHAVGDEVLRAFAAVVAREADASVMAARTGGEEFVLVMSGTSAKLARQRAEAIRRCFASRPVDTTQGPIACTASAGISVAGSEGRMLDGVLMEADKALYRAKRGGRDRIAVHGLRVAA